VVVDQCHHPSAVRGAPQDGREKAGCSEETVLLATGRYLGESFDDALIDTLFLTPAYLLARDARAIARMRSSAGAREWPDEKRRR